MLSGPIAPSNSARPICTRIGALVLSAGAVVSAPAAGAAGEGDRIMVQTALYTVHYHSGPDHVKSPWLVGAEYQHRNHFLAGYAYFKNSFGQKSHYAYGGRTWKLGVEDTSYWYLKLTGGVIVGYREPYEDKIPFNHNGIAPGLIASIGYQFDRFNAQLNALGTSGLMLTLGYDLFR